MVTAHVMNTSCCMYFFFFGFSILRPLRQRLSIVRSQEPGNLDSGCSLLFLLLEKFKTQTNAADLVLFASPSMRLPKGALPIRVS